VADATQAVERGVQDRPRRASAQIGDEADATGVAFFARREQVEPPSEVEMERSRLVRLT
jgi:hypothetical protein